MLRRSSFRALATLAALLAASLAFVNGPRANARTEAAVDRYARELVGAMGDRRWLITGGNLDASLQLAAWDLHQPLRVINVHRGRDRPYMNRVAGWFEDDRLRQLSRLGTLSLIREWFSSATNIADEVALTTTPDLLQAAGLTPVPHGLLYVGVSDPETLDASALLRVQRACAQRLAADLAPRDRDPSARAAFREAGRAHLSRLFNDLGVVLAGRDRPDLACEAYREARRINPANLSALLNLGSLSATLPAVEAEQVQREIASRTAGPARPDWWSLSRHDGFVQQPEAHAALGRLWAVSGQPALLVAGFQRAVEQAVPENQTAARLGLAAAYRLDDRPAASREVYDAVLQTDPGNPGALLGLARLDANAGCLDDARARLARLTQHGAPPPELVPAWAGVLLRLGDLDRTRLVLEAFCGADPDHLAARAMLTGVAIEQHDEAAVEAGLRELRRLEGGRGFHVCAAEALRALARGDAATARTCFKHALVRRPASTETLERILRLDNLLGPEPSTEHFAARLVSLDPRSALGTYTLGALQLRQQAYAAARIWLERSVGLARTPAALNDLAWVLAHEGDPARGEALAREALREAPHMAAAWDTLAETLTRQQRPAEAVEALRRAIELEGRTPLLLARLAAGAAQCGSSGEAASLLKEIRESRKPLSPELRQAMAEAEARLRQRAAPP